VCLCGYACVLVRVYICACIISECVHAFVVCVCVCVSGVCVCVDCSRHGTSLYNSNFHFGSYSAVLRNICSHMKEFVVGWVRHLA
jgi:hypothetical protein